MGVGVRRCGFVDEEGRVKGGIVTSVEIVISDSSSIRTDHCWLGFSESSKMTEISYRNLEIFFLGPNPKPIKYT